MASFEELVSEGWKAPFHGWNFSYLDGRYLQARPPWNYPALVSSRLPGVRSLLDIGTGGGEFLSSLKPLPEVACVTEGYRPNTKVALAALGPLGVGVVETLCDDNREQPQRGELPFRDSCFDLVIARHESYVPREVKRVMGPRGLFITQQVGPGNIHEIHSLFGSRAREPPWEVLTAEEGLEREGLHVDEHGAWSGVSRFLDVGALVYFLKAIPWEVPSFTPEKFELELRQVHQRISDSGSFEVTTARFYVVASRP
jgi:SAM-dependent methyltransferase